MAEHWRRGRRVAAGFGVCYRHVVKSLPFFFFFGSALAMAAALAACSSNKNDAASPAVDVPDAAPSADADVPASYPAVVLAPEPQRSGDAAKGYRALVNEAYVPCGIPYSAYSMVFGAAKAADTVPGREGRNATLAYNFTSMTTKDGVELVTSNCLTCHAGRIDGKLVVGLGNADGDFTSDAASQIQNTGYVGLLLSDAKEKAEWQKWKERVDTVAPYSVLSTRGPNPADGFTAVLFAHHDPKTMAWSSTPLMDVNRAPSPDGARFHPVLGRRTEGQSPDNSLARSPRFSRWAAAGPARSKVVKPSGSRAPSPDGARFHPVLGR